MEKVKAKLAISLVTSNGTRYLSFCLKSVFEQTSQDFSLLIIDNGSNDDTVRFIKENYPQISLVEHPKNLGFAKAHNQAICWSDSVYVMMLNQDILLDKNYLLRALEFLDQHPEAAAVSGKVLAWDFEKNQRTKLIDSLGLRVLKNHRVVEIGQGEEDQGQFDQNEEVFGVSGAVPIYRRSALDEVKVTLDQGLKVSEYLDEDFFSYKEDVDLAYRLRLAGFKSFYLPGAVAYHDRTAKGGVDLSDRAVKRARRGKDRQVKVYSYKNHLLTLLKNEFFGNFIKFFFPIFFYELKKFGWLIFFEQSTLAGLAMYRKQKKKALAKRKFIIKKIRKISADELAKWYQ
ncbi:MAG: glycosyltransferase family 2 protein [Candidatus Komeilibacteria bacterium]|nr:glycosyltransferase family 2 protein [Candidatus Komeilibacteria bacterium]